MFTIMFCLALMWASWKMFAWGLKAAWGITRLVCMVFLIPLFLVGLVFVGLIYIAIPLLVIVGVVALVGGMMER